MTFWERLALYVVGSLIGAAVVGITLAMIWPEALVPGW